MEQSVRPVILEGRKKIYTEDGGHRAVAPEETLRKYQQHISPITGAVIGLQRHIAANDGLLHVYLAGENYAGPHYNLKHLQGSLRSRSAGKGISDLQAKASGLCESTALCTSGIYLQRWTDDLRDDVLFCQELVEKNGMEMLVLDQTRPDIGLPVVKVIVPGLRHFWARFAPGRLYDVPVAQGWHPAPLSEEELNPVPMFL